MIMEGSNNTGGGRQCYLMAVVAVEIVVSSMSDIGGCGGRGWR